MGLSFILQLVAQYHAALALFQLSLKSAIYSYSKPFEWSGHCILIQSASRCEEQGNKYWTQFIHLDILRSNLSIKNHSDEQIRRKITLLKACLCLGIMLSHDLETKIPRYDAKKSTFWYLLLIKLSSIIISYQIHLDETNLSEMLRFHCNASVSLQCVLLLLTDWAGAL